MITGVPLRAGKGWAISRSWTCNGVSGLIFSLIKYHCHSGRISTKEKSKSVALSKPENASVDLSELLSQK